MLFQKGKLKYSVGFVIGRFQPFHFGHEYLFLESLKVCDTLIVGIGSSNVHDSQNPYSFEIRKKMIKAFASAENISSRIIQITPIPDVPDDSEWLQICLSTAKNFDIVIGDNEWVNGIFENAGYPVLRIGHYKRELYEGQKIRKLRSNGENWEDRVPKYVLTILNQES